MKRRLSGLSGLLSIEARGEERRSLEGLCITWRETKEGRRIGQFEREPRPYEARENRKRESLRAISAVRIEVKSHRRASGDKGSQRKDAETGMV